LDANGLQVEWDMTCDEGLEVHGEVNLAAARIGGRLVMTGVDFIQTTSDQRLLNLENALAADLFLPRAPTAQGIDLTDARVGQLHDPVWRPPDSRVPWYRRWRRKAPESGAPPYRPRLAGFVYESLGPGSDDPAARLDWIAHAEEGYLPDAYDQLVAVYRRGGREEDARDVAVAKLRRRREYLRPPARWWNRFMDWTVRYGYHTWRAIYALLAVMVIGWVVFAWASWDHLEPTRSKDQLPQFAPWMYSIDSVLPVINLGQESAWAPTGAAQYWYAASVLAGWILGTALIAALTAMLTRE
jgi:hypothetical protein